MTTNTSRNFALFLGTPTLSGSIVTPTCGGDVTSSEIVVTWSGVTGVQQSYTVQVFAEAGMTTLLYYSGVINSAIASHTIPAGTFPNGVTYYLLVDWVETDGTTGETQVPCTFTTDYATAGNVSGLTVKTIGGCRSADIPCFVLRWTQVVPGGGETFVQYDVKRREPSVSALWTRIATITAIGTLTYTDYNVRARAVYQYAVVYQATIGGIYHISAPQSPAPVGWVDFDYAWVHEVGNPANFTMFDQEQATVTVKQDLAQVQTWGRSAPIYQIGELQYREVALPGTERSNHDRTRWKTLYDMAARQRSARAVFCVRLGSAQELLFCTMVGLSRSIAQKSYQPSLSLVEIDYSEAV